MGRVRCESGAGHRDYAPGRGLPRRDGPRRARLASRRPGPRARRTAVRAIVGAAVRGRRACRAHLLGGLQPRSGRRGAFGRDRGRRHLRGAARLRARGGGDRGDGRRPSRPADPQVRQRSSVARAEGHVRVLAYARPARTAATHRCSPPSRVDAARNRERPASGASACPRKVARGRACLRRCNPGRGATSAGPRAAPPRGGPRGAGNRVRGPSPWRRAAGGKRRSTGLGFPAQTAATRLSRLASSGRAGSS